MAGEQSFKHPCQTQIPGARPAEACEIFVVQYSSTKVHSKHRTWYVLLMSCCAACISRQAVRISRHSIQAFPMFTNTHPSSVHNHATNMQLIPCRSAEHVSPSHFCTPENINKLTSVTSGQIGFQGSISSDRDTHRQLLVCCR